MNRSDELEKGVQRIIQRLAKAVLNLTSIGKRQQNLISQFISEDCQRLITSYRRLIAEATLSCFSMSIERHRFLKSFGYDVSFPATVPCLPLVVVFGLDSVLVLWPLIASPWIAFGPFPIKTTNIAAFALAHSISLTMAVIWAIVPRISASTYQIDRIASHCIYGLLSYVSSVFAWIALRFIIVPIPGMPLATHPVFTIATNSLYFVVLTVCIGSLVEMRMTSFEHYSANRGRDSIITSIALTASAVLIQLCLIPITPPGFPWYLYVTYYAVTFLEGFVLGFCLP
jgi:hypothetical protein